MSEPVVADVELVFGPGLAFRLEAVPEPVLGAVHRYFSPQLAPVPGSAGAAIRVESAPPPPSDAVVVPVLGPSPLEVTRCGDSVLFSLPGLVGWCQPQTGRAGLHVDHPTAHDAEVFVALGVLAMLLELSASRGWFAVHAAAVAHHGRGILLPGDSGVGKTTTFLGAQRAGLDLLSDDLVWLCEVPEGFELRPLIRGVPSRPVPRPTVERASLAALVCPSIVATGPARLEPMTTVATVAELAREGFLSVGEGAASRFQTLVRAARSVPTWRLLAGPVVDEVPPLLRSLLGPEK